MSEKIKSKDLSYDSTLPPFLQRLRDQQSGHGDSDRHERAIARPRKPKDPNDDDGPTVIDESGETLTKEEYEKLAGLAEANEHVKGHLDPETEPKASGALPIDELPAESERKRVDNVTDGTAQKKRKAAKVIHEGNATEETGDGDLAKTKTFKKAKKKAKVKLNFDDDEAT